MSSTLPINIESLLRQRKVEGERIEYKAGWNPDPILRTLCAFANDLENLGGGYVVIGQDCSKSGMPIFPPKGLPDNQLDRIQRELLGFCNLIQPPYFPMLSVERFAGCNLIILWAPGGQHRPYKVPRSVLARKKEYRHYIRRYSSTVEAKGDDERELISLTARVPFDDRFNQAAGADDLSPRLMEEFLREVGSDLADEARELSTEALGRKMNVVDGPAESVLPKNVGLLFFNEEPRHFFPATQIDVVYFPEGPGGDQFEEKVFSGPLSQITRDAISFIDRNYLKETVIKHPDRPEAERLWNFPLAAIEEAIVNAVYHRSYEIREPIEVRISMEELVILSFPGPDRSIKMDDLSAGRAVSRRYRNRRIGEFLKELDLTEGRSTGITKMLKVLARNGSPAPVFETDEERSYFLIRLPVHPKAVSEETPVKTPVKVSEETSEKILTEIRRNRYVTIKELSQLIGVTTRSVERNLKKLQDSGILKRVGPDRGGHWVVKGDREGDSGGGEASEKASEKTSEKIIVEIRRKPEVTIAELAQLIGVTTRSVERNLKKLQDSGILKRVGPAKGGHWLVKPDV